MTRLEALKCSTNVVIMIDINNDDCIHFDKREVRSNKTKQGTINCFLAPYAFLTIPNKPWHWEDTFFSISKILDNGFGRVICTKACWKPMNVPRAWGRNLIVYSW